MKKLLITLVVLAMVVPACCTRVDPTTKVNTKSFANCLAAAQQLFCNPTAAQQAEAGAVLAFLTTGVQVATFVINVPITAAEVTQVFSLVQAGACVLTTDMQMALDWYNALVSAIQTKALQDKKMGAKMIMPPAIPNLQNFNK